MVLPNNFYLEHLLVVWLYFVLLTKTMLKSNDSEVLDEGAQMNLHNQEVSQNDDEVNIYDDEPIDSEIDPSDNDLPNKEVFEYDEKYLLR